MAHAENFFLHACSFTPQFFVHSFFPDFKMAPVVAAAKPKRRDQCWKQDDRLMYNLTVLSFHQNSSFQR